MRLPIYQVDAFATELFKGNPAAIIPLDTFLPDELLQAIAAENNLSETAYLVKAGDRYRLRWFTPGCEVPLCGHATLASAAVVLNRLEAGKNEVAFETASGLLTVKRAGTGFVMDFPASTVTRVETVPGVAAALGAEPVEVYKNDRFTLVLLQSASSVRSLEPVMEAVQTLDPHGVIVTAVGDEGYHFVSRFFAPAMGVNEDPVTGSAHCILTPFWAARLNRTEFHAFQASARGGDLTCRIVRDRVELEGSCVFYLEGSIELPLF